MNTNFSTKVLVFKFIACFFAVDVVAVFVALLHTQPACAEPHSYHLNVVFVIKNESNSGSCVSNVRNRNRLCLAVIYQIVVIVRRSALEQ